jgi:hypothetical protein
MYHISEDSSLIMQYCQDFTSHISCYMSWFQQNSPLLQRRGRRASSSSRDHSESQAESHRSTSPHARFKVKFASLGIA